MARLFTRSEIERRNHKDDAAVVIDNVVYDVTHFLEHHPGGAEILLNNAGKDASKCFRDVGHSADAVLWRQEFRIGEVVEGDRWHVATPLETSAEPERASARALLDALAPPLLLAVLACLGYLYLL